MKTWTAWLGAVGSLLIALAGLALANPFRWIGLGGRSLLWLWLFLAAVGLGTLSVTFLLLTIARRGLRRLPPALAWLGLFLAALVATGLGLLVWSYGILTGPNGLWRPPATAGSRSSCMTPTTSS